MRVTITDILKLDRCGFYTTKMVLALAAGRKQVTIQDITAAPIPIMDRLWVLIHVCPKRIIQKWMLDCAARMIPNRRGLNLNSWRAIAVARAYLQGKATYKELRSAKVAAWVTADKIKEEALMAEDGWAADVVAWAVTATGARTTEETVKPALAVSLSMDSATRTVNEGKIVEVEGEREWRLQRLMELCEHGT